MNRSVASTVQNVHRKEVRGIFRYKLYKRNNMFVERQPCLASRNPAQGRQVEVFRPAPISFDDDIRPELELIGAARRVCQLVSKYRRVLAVIAAGAHRKKIGGRKNKLSASVSVSSDRNLAT